MKSDIRKILYFSYILLFLLLGNKIKAQAITKCGQGNEEFLLVFSDANSIKDAGGIEKIEMSDRLHIQGIPGTQLIIFDQKYEIPASGYLIVEEEFPQVPDEFSNNVIKIKSGNKDLSVNVERISPYSSCGFTLLPVSQWGKEYIIPGYQDQSKKYKVNSFIDIFSANKKKTSVIIKDNQGNLVEKITLKSGQNYEYNSIEDLTGYSVEASGNVGVISGNHCLRISSACDHAALMLRDNSQLGTKYYNPGSSFFSSFTIYRLVGTQNNTQVRIDGLKEIKLNKGEFYEYQREDPHLIESSHPVLAYSLFNKSALGSPEYSLDPSLYFIPSEDQAVNFVQFSFPEYMIYSKDIRLIMKTDKVNFLLLDGEIPEINWDKFSHDPYVSFATLSFSDRNIHTFSVSDPDAYFIPVMMARGWDVSLGTSLKNGFTNLLTGENPPCPNREHITLNGKTESILKPKEIRPKEIILTDIYKPIIVEKDVIDLLVFDNAEEDGDIISLYLNERLVYSNVSVLKAGTILEFELEKGKNTITIKAENEGSIYPNTAGLTFDDGVTRQTIILHNRKGQSKNLTIISR